MTQTIILLAVAAVFYSIFFVFVDKAKESVAPLHIVGVLVITLGVGLVVASKI